MVATSSRPPPSRPSRRELLGVVDALGLPSALFAAAYDNEGGMVGFEVVHRNEAARRFLAAGDDDEGLLGQLGTEDRAQLEDALARCLQSDEPVKLRITATRATRGDAPPALAPLSVSGSRIGGLVLLTWQQVDGESAKNHRAEAMVARSDAHRLAVLQRVTAALIGANSVEQVAEVMLEELFRAKPLVAGVVAVLDEASDSLRLAGSRGISDEVRARIAHMPLSSRFPVVVSTRSGVPQWLSSRAELLAAYPHLEKISESLTQAVAVLPLEADLGPVGALGLSFKEPTAFDDDLKEFLMTLARQCARAIERALLVESERIARVRAARMQRITETLAGAETQREAARLAVQLLEETLEALHVACYLVGPEEGVMVRGAASLAANDEDHDEAPARMMLPAVSPLAACVRSKQAHYTDVEATSTAPRAFLPLLHDGKAIGAVALRFSPKKRFPPDDRGYYGAIAHQVSLAVDRARLREENLIRSRHLAALAEASVLFAASALDVSVLVQSVVRFARAAVGETCVLSLVAEDGKHLEAVALEAPSSDDEARLWSVFEKRPLRVGEGVTGSAVVTGEPVFSPWLELSEASASAEPPYDEVWRQFGRGGVIVVPLRAHGETLGALTLARRGDRRYTRDDLSLLVDIGERAALALYTARLYDETQGAVRVRDDFLSIAGHELRTPLTALHLQLQALVRFPERAATPDIVRERARKMSQQTDRLARLITELLDVSRIVRGRLTLEVSQVDLVELTHDVLEICDADLKRADCEVKLSLPDALVGSWDRTRIEQVLQNLILNACKYGRSRPVSLSVEQEGQRAVIVVRDEGIGIAAEDQARIFERFERAVPSRHFGGFGLGLWISREVIEAHGGSIAVDSEPERGATFRVELPLTQGAP